MSDYRDSRHADVSYFSQFKHAFDVIGDEIITNNAKALTQAGENLKNNLRQQTLHAVKYGLGQNLANAWQMKKGPSDLRAWQPGVLVYSKAPIIHAAFNYGGIVRANSAKYLAIPTKYVPPQLAMKTNNDEKNGAKKSSLPELVEQWFGRKLVFVKGRNGKPDVLFMPMAVMAKKSGRGYKAATKRRINQGRDVHSLPMFILVKQAIHIKRLDIEAAEKDAINELIRLLEK